MSLSRINIDEHQGRISPVKVLEGFYGLMMPLWSLNSNVLENTKSLQQEMINTLQDANEDYTDRVVNAIDHNQPKELMSALMIAYQTSSYCALMLCNAVAEQQYEFLDTWFQMIDKSHQQIYKDTSQL